MIVMVSIWAGERVRLRGIEPDDWEAFQEFDTHSADVRTADRLHPPRSRAGYQRWAAEEAVAAPAGDLFRLAVESRPGHHVVGTVNTVDPEPRAGRFGYGVAIGRDHQRQGYATEAVTLLLRYMFGERRYHKCEIGVYAFNDASVQLHRRLGFVEEGRLRHHEFFAGRHHDLVLYGLTVDEFAARHPFETL